MNVSPSSDSSRERGPGARGSLSLLLSRLAKKEKGSSSTLTLTVLMGCAEALGAAAPAEAPSTATGPCLPVTAAATGAVGAAGLADGAKRGDWGELAKRAPPLSGRAFGGARSIGTGVEGSTDLDVSGIWRDTAERGAEPSSLATVAHSRSFTARLSTRNRSLSTPIAAASISSTTRGLHCSRKSSAFRTCSLLSGSSGSLSRSHSAASSLSLSCSKSPSSFSSSSPLMIWRCWCWCW
jgi:hypothetical protein